MPVLIPLKAIVLNTFSVSATFGLVTDVRESGLGGRQVWVLGPARERYYYAHLDDWRDGLASDADCGIRRSRRFRQRLHLHLDHGLGCESRRQNQH